MINRKLFYISTITLIAVIAICGQVSASSSAHYQIAIHSMGSQYGDGNSSSYNIIGGTSAYKTGTYPLSNERMLYQGFSHSAFGLPDNPDITSITPNSGYNIAPVTISKISGRNFKPGAVVKLSKTGESEIRAYNVNIISSSEINCKFDLAGKNTGTWDLVITNTDGKSGTLTGGFEITGYPYGNSLAINSPNPFDPAREHTTIMYKLEKNTDVNVYLFTVTASLIWKRSYLSGTNGGKLGENSISWNGMDDFGELKSNGLYIIHVVEISTGKTLAKGKIAILRR